MKSVTIDFEFIRQQIEISNIKGCTITEVQLVDTGSLPLTDGGTITELPAFVRIAANLKPTVESNINMELWLPLDHWNERFLGTGNGGGAGHIAYQPLAFGLRRGFATANTDMGTSPNANILYNQPEKWADFGYRSTHEMTEVAKRLIEICYQKPAKYAYFIGCSTGGQQALTEAQRYPSDYNGIIAGAPANNRTHLHTAFLWNYKATNLVPGSLMPKDKIAGITQAVVTYFGDKDGGAPGDSFLTDPGKCRSDMEILRRTDLELSDAQWAALKLFYDGPVNPRTAERIYSPIPYGSENCWGGIEFQQSPDIHEHFYMFKWMFGENFDYTKFDFDRDLDAMDAQLAPILNANNPDLSAMKALGGKILMYSGLSDPIVPYQDAVHYYERVIDHQQGLEQTQDFFCFYLVPGMGHCGGGPGLNDVGLSGAPNVPQDSEHDLLCALMEWVESGKAPSKIIATAFNGGFAANGISYERPIFPYPQIPQYVGEDPKQPNSFQGTFLERDNIPRPAERYLK